MWFVYLIRCSDDSIYTGITNDLQKRINNHNLGYKISKCRYTSGRLPVVLIKYFEYDTKSEALKREYQIKKLDKKDKLEL